MYSFDNFIVTFNVADQVLKLHPAGDKVSLGDFHPSALSGPDLAKLFNQMVLFAKASAMPGDIPEAVKRFADKLSALKRVSNLQAQIAAHLATARDADAATKATAPEPVIEDKPTKPATVVAPKAKKSKAKPDGAGDQIVETKGLKDLPPKVTCVATKKDGSTYVVGQRSFTDDMRITNIVAEPGHKEREPRWHLYREGMTVAEFIAAAKAWLRTQPAFADRKDGGADGLNWKVRDWLAADAKRSNRITIG